MADRYQGGERERQDLYMKVLTGQVDATIEAADLPQLLWMADVLHGFVSDGKMNDRQKEAFQTAWTKVTKKIEELKPRQAEQPKGEIAAPRAGSLDAFWMSLYDAASNGDVVRSDGKVLPKEHVPQIKAKFDEEIGELLQLSPAEKKVLLEDLQSGRPQTERGKLVFYIPSGGGFRKRLIDEMLAVLKTDEKERPDIPGEEFILATLAYFDGAIDRVDYDEDFKKEMRKRIEDRMRHFLSSGVDIEYLTDIKTMLVQANSDLASGRRPSIDNVVKESLLRGITSQQDILLTYTEYFIRMIDILLASASKR